MGLAFSFKLTLASLICTTHCRNFIRKRVNLQAFRHSSIEACIGRYQYPICLEVNGQIFHIPLNQQTNIHITDFPKYPMSRKVNKNIPEMTSINYSQKNILFAVK